MERAAREMTISHYNKTGEVPLQGRMKGKEEERLLPHSKLKKFETRKKECAAALQYDRGVTVNPNKILP